MLKQLDRGALVTVIMHSPGDRRARSRRKPVPGPWTRRSEHHPAGGVFFTEDTDTNEPSFGNYDVGGSVAGNFNRYVGIEGEVSARVAASRRACSSGQRDRRSAHTAHAEHGGNLVVSALNRSSVTPYVTGGVGETERVRNSLASGINSTETFIHRATSAVA